MISTSALFDEVTDITLNNIAYIDASISLLSEEQLTWKNASKDWNIKEVLAHLNEYAKHYHSKFEKKIDTTRFRDPKEFYTSSPLGKSTWNTVKLGKSNNIKRKLKSQKYFNPLIVPSIVTDSIVEEFKISQNDLLRIIERAKEINIRKAKISIPLNQAIRFRFGDALLFVVYHNQRHLQQIKNIQSHSNFPK